MFLYGGLDEIRNPGSKLDAAEPVVRTVAKRLGLEISTRDAVLVNGFAQLIGGSLLAVGALPRLAAAVLATSIVPTTLAGHRFWEEESEQARRGQRIHFLKNASMLGGLLLAAVDTEGEPSVSWRAHHAARRFAQRHPLGVGHRHE
jgi:putative oxidoreductase